MRRPLIRLVALVQLSSLGLAAAALAVPDDALRCQLAIGEAGRAYAVATLRTLVACNNDSAAGRSCNAARRDRVVARAARALVTTTAKACRSVALATLHFPGGCPDATQGSFVVGDLHRCLGTLLASFAGHALVFDYPDLQTFSGEERRCQRGLARAAGAFLATDLRIRTRCLDARLRGSLPESVDCVAEVPPYGPGTGDATTDAAVTQTTVRLTSRLSEACVGADLARLGFPGRCLDVVSGEPSLTNVESCVRATHAYVARLMLSIEYPPVVNPTPTPAGTPAPTATPVVESLRLAPAAARKPLGFPQNFTVTAHMSDGNDRNFTQRVFLSSSDESVAVCQNVDGNRGKVLTVGGGTALITATEPVTGITSDPATLIVSTCVRNRCVVGEPLGSDCEPCVTTICTADPSCCADAWTQACVDAVSSLCGEGC